MPGFSLKAYHQDDLEAVADVCDLAMRKDKYALFSAARKDNPYNHAKAMRQEFERCFSRPKDSREVIIAVDNQSNEIVGVICWRIRLDASAASSSSDTEDNVDEADIVKDHDSHGPLDDLIHAHYATYRDRIMSSDTRCLYICTLAVRPDFHGRGIASALVKRGTDRADKEQVFCWVHSSEDAMSFYKKCGFEKNDELIINLDAWTNEMGVSLGSQDNTWGNYSFPYMIRQPQKPD